MYAKPYTGDINVNIKHLFLWHMVDKYNEKNGSIKPSIDWLMQYFFSFSTSGLFWPLLKHNSHTAIHFCYNKKNNLDIILSS